MKNSARGQLKGIAAIEMVILLPVYFIISLLVVFLGDLMFVKQVTESAARYAAWKRDSVSVSQVNSRTLAQKLQAQISGVGYHADGYPQSESQSSELNSRKLTPGSERLDAVTPNQAQDWAKKVAHVDFEGKSGFAGLGYSFNGGWVKEFKVGVTATYNFHAMGFSARKVGSTSYVLSGKTASSKMPGGIGGFGGGTTSFAFRDNNPIGNLFGTKWDVNAFGSNANNPLVKEFSSVDAGLFDKGTPYPDNPGP